MLKNSVEWRSAYKNPTEYKVAIDEMESKVAAVRAENALQQVWLLEHPSIYTAGTASLPDDLLDPERFPVFKTGRGGQYTYHGPGQLVAYVMLDLAKRGSDISKFVNDLEQWIIKTLSEFNIRGESRKGRVGIWVNLGKDSEGKDIEGKIAAIGVRVRRWVSYHGISINIRPNLEHFSGIIPCGVKEHGVTSLLDLGISATTTEVETALRKNFESVFSNKTIDIE